MLLVQDRLMVLQLDICILQRNIEIFVFEIGEERQDIDIKL